MIFSGIFSNDDIDVNKQCVMSGSKVQMVSRKCPLYLLINSRDHT